MSVVPSDTPGLFMAALCEALDNSGVIEALEDNLVDLRNPLRVRHSPATRAEEADPDKRCHQSVPPDRSISTLVNEAGYTVARSASVVTELITRLILNRHLIGC